MKLRKILAAGLCASMMLSLAACGEKGGEISVSDNTEVSTVTNNAVVDKYVPVMPTESVDAGLFVEPVPGIKDDFIRGVDISSVLVEEESGIIYKNANGEPEDIFKILADSGVNYVRVRVWNDPYDSEGHGYGGGNNDYAKAAEIGRRAAQYGMKLLVDFHYSDFWADPTKQMVPKAWDKMNYREKSEAAYEFTLEAMNAILDAGADVGMVQIGNETNNGMCGETVWSCIALIMGRARDAVLEAGSLHGNNDIKIAVHFTNPENRKNITEIVRKLDTYKVEYDVFGMSYYPYWHGTQDNLTEVLKEIHEKTGKEVMVAETSYMYTIEEISGHQNTVSGSDVVSGYTPTPQGQAQLVRDVCAAVNAVGDGAIGMFYWEPAWIQAQAETPNGTSPEEQFKANMKLWAEKGSGWASEYAGVYDPNDAGQYYGGSSWENQAMFDRDGVALPSLSVFKYLKYGATGELKLDGYDQVGVDLLPGDELNLPETVMAYFNDTSNNGPVSVTWDEEMVNGYDTFKIGTGTIKGVTELGDSIVASIKVASVNLFEDPSFEKGTFAGWTIEEKTAGTVDCLEKEGDAHSGKYSMHYWCSGTVEFDAGYAFTDLEPGIYSFSVFTQGGDCGDDYSDMYIYAKSGDSLKKTGYKPTAWAEWTNPKVDEIEVGADGKLTVGIHYRGAAGAWGTFDDLYLGKIN